MFILTHAVVSFELNGTISKSVNDLTIPLCCQPSRQPVSFYAAVVEALNEYLVINYRDYFHPDEYEVECLVHVYAEYDMPVSDLFSLSDEEVHLQFEKYSNEIESILPDVLRRGPLFEVDLTSYSPLI